MKASFIALLSSMIVLSACSSSSSTTKTADLEATAAMIESGNFQFTVRSASPSGGRTVQITSEYTMKAVDGSYEAHLPYFGRAYSGGYGDGGGVEFKGKPEDIEITRNDRKNTIAVKFSMTSGSELYEVKLQVGSSGYGNLVINSRRRQTISYYGLTTALKD